MNEELGTLGIEANLSCDYGKRERETVKEEKLVHYILYSSIFKIIHRFYQNNQ